ncbi:MAG TPA: hypothetical protein VF814_00400 [Casimicrobiaceae bacterium]
METLQTVDRLICEACRSGTARACFLRDGTPAERDFCLHSGTGELVAIGPSGRRLVRAWHDVTALEFWNEVAELTVALPPGIR